MQQITLAQGLMISIFAALVGIDFWLETLFIFRPLVVATVVGIILGDVKTGLIAGGMTELVFAGLTPAGGTQPPNPVLAGIMSVVLTYINKGDPLLGVSLALPFSILMQYVILFFYSIFSFSMKSADEAAENAEPSVIARINITLTIIVSLSYFVVVFLSSYLAQDSIRNIVASMPAWLSNSFSVIGGILPAVGFGMLLRILLRVENLAYFIIGFILVSFASFSNLLPLALVGLALALIQYYSENNKEDESEGI